MRRVRAGRFLALTLLVLAAAAVWSITRGAGPNGLVQVARALFGLAGVDPTDALIVREIRLPRLVVAICAGASLSLAGTVMQAVFRNPLASPEVMGTMMGAAVGSVLAIVTGFAASSVMATPISAFAVAMAVTVVVFVIAHGGSGISVSGILLAGIAMNALLGSAIAFLTQAVSEQPLRSGEILVWLMGGLEARTASHAWTVVIGLVAFGAPLVLCARDMDLLTLRDEGAATLGVPVRALRNVLLLLACGLTAVTVSCTGGVTFVGLVVPHLVRLVVGPAHRALLPCAAVAGALILVLADCVCRVLVARVDLTLGVVTSALGAPFFLFLLAKHRRGEAL